MAPTSKHLSESTHCRGALGPCVPDLAAVTEARGSAAVVFTKQSFARPGQTGEWLRSSPANRQVSGFRALK